MIKNDDEERTLTLLKYSGDDTCIFNLEIETDIQLLEQISSL